MPTPARGEAFSQFNKFVNKVYYTMRVVRAYSAVFELVRNILLPLGCDKYGVVYNVVRKDKIKLIN